MRIGTPLHDHVRFRQGWLRIRARPPVIANQRLEHLFGHVAIEAHQRPTVPRSKLQGWVAPRLRSGDTEGCALAPRNLRISVRVP